jgi:hypothetical protein
MTFEYANRWFRVSFEFFGFGRKPILRKYTVDCADVSRVVKQRIVRNISAQVREEARSIRQ